MRRASNRRLRMSRRDHRLPRSQAVVDGPQAAGQSHQRPPDRCTWTISERTRRSLTRRAPGWFVGKCGAIAADCRSLDRNSRGIRSSQTTNRPKAPIPKRLIWVQPDGTARPSTAAQGSIGIPRPTSKPHVPALGLARLKDPAAPTRSAPRPCALFFLWSDMHREASCKWAGTGPSALASAVSRGFDRRSRRAKR